MCIHLLRSIVVNTRMDPDAGDENETYLGYMMVSGSRGSGGRGGSSRGSGPCSAPDLQKPISCNKNLHLESLQEHLRQALGSGFCLFGVVINRRLSQGLL